MSKTKERWVYTYVYPEDLRDLYVNGAIGGITPRNEIYVHLYSERHAFPKRVTYEVKDGKIIKESEVEVGGNVVRLVQASIVMDLETAVAIRDLLSMQIENINQKIKKAEKNEGENQ